MSLTIAVGAVDFLRDPKYRITRDHAKQVKLLAPIDDDGAGNLDTVQESPAGTILIHLVLTDGRLIKSEDSIPADGLSRSDVSVSVVESYTTAVSGPVLVVVPDL